MVNDKKKVNKFCLHIYFRYAPMLQICWVAKHYLYIKSLHYVLKKKIDM